MESTVFSENNEIKTDDGDMDTYQDPLFEVKELKSELNSNVKCETEE